MLLIHRSERADPLVSALGELLQAPVADPFAAELVAVPSAGVERWLAQQLSHVLGAHDGDGVCANVVFPSSNRLLDDAVAAVDAGYADAVQRWSAERSVWPLLGTVGDCVAEPWASMLAVHLGLEPGGRERGRRFTVASTLARHFDAYGRSRPAMLRAWHAGLDTQGDGTPLPEDLRWQAELWRRARAELGPSPAELLGIACERLRADPAAVDLPPVFSIFGTTRITASRIAALDALAAERDVHLWLHHPSPALWEAVRAGAATRNPLLASLSRDIRELQQLLPAAADVHHPIGARPDTLLGRLQQQLADDTVARPYQPDDERPDDEDRSLSVHACHGPARQVEVVREVVLGLLDDDPTLEPRDIVIMCPNVETFAPLVAASFGMADEPGGHPAGQLRVRLADRSLRRTNPLFSLTTQLLDLAANRVTATQLLDLAAAPPVRALFGFTDDDMEQLRDWTADANARWGLDAQHRAPYGLDHLAQGTWRAAVDRLLLGVAMEQDDRWLGTVLPLDDVDSGAVDLAGRLAELLDRVDTAVRAMQQSHTVPQWMALLGELVLSLGEPQHAWQAAQLRSEFADIAEAAGGVDIQLARADLAALLHPRLAGRPTRAGFRTGTLTVCTLVPMRSVPHRVVCLLGLDDGAFPRNAVVDGDDVLARDPRPGERDVRSEDRQLFLDAICAAQEHLVITYTGADPRTGAEVPPCVPLGELLDVVGEHVVTRHPLQPFDARNYRPGTLGSSRPFSFDPVGLAGARAAAGPRVQPRGLLSGALPPSHGADGLDDLVRFLTHPMREFLKQRLQISTWRDDDEPADALPVDVGGLPEWAIGTRVLRDRLAGMSVDTCRQVEYRRGDLPPGELGRRVLDTVSGTVEALIGACATERAAAPARSVDVAVPLRDGRVLAGTVGGLHGSTLIDVTYSAFGPRLRLESWIRYLALVVTLDDPALRTLGVGRHSGGARRQVVRGIDPVEAVGVLEDLVALRDAGLRAPLPLPLKTSAVYAERRYDARSVDEALDAARSRWQDGQYPGECSDAAHQLVLGGTVALPELLAFDPTGRDELRFEPLAVRLWTPLISAEHSS